MNALTRRIRRLEDQLRPRNGTGILVVASGVGLTLDPDSCVDILRERGFLPTGLGMCLVDLLAIPDDLNAEETERFLRENGAEICDGAMHSALRTTRNREPVP